MHVVHQDLSILKKYRVFQQTDVREFHERIYIYMMMCTETRGGVVLRLDTRHARPLSRNRVAGQASLKGAPLFEARLGQ
jgi:hypothetical protein